MPVAGASRSTAALSVSTTTSGSPAVTCWPSALSHSTILPVSWAMPSAGRMTLVAMNDLPRRFARSATLCPFCYAVCYGAAAAPVGMDIEVGLDLTRRGEGSVDGVIARAGDQQLLGGEACDDLAAIFGDYELLLDARGGPAVGGGPEGFQRE